MFQPRFDKRDDAHPVLVGKEKEMYESKNWPKSFSTPVDITKVRIDAFEPWINKRLSELMGVDDDILVDYCMSQLKDLGESDAKRNSQLAGDGGLVFNEKPKLDPKRLQISLTGFMAKKAGIFVRELWDLLLSAQSNEHGIPQLFIDERKKEYENKNNDRKNDNRDRERYKDRKKDDLKDRLRVKKDYKHKDRDKHRHRYHRHKERSKKTRSRTKSKSSSSSSSSKSTSLSRSRSKTSSSYQSNDYHPRRHRHKSHSNSSEYRRRRKRSHPSSSDSSLSSEHRHRRRKRRSRSSTYSSTSSSVNPEHVKEMSRKLARDRS